MDYRIKANSADQEEEADQEEHVPRPQVRQHGK
jgi:hypothetical protein